MVRIYGINGDGISIKEQDMTERQRRSITSTYQLLYSTTKNFRIDNASTWLLIIGLAETYEFVMRWTDDI